MEYFTAFKIHIIFSDILLWHLLIDMHILANCPYLIGTVPILTQEKVWKRSNFTTCPYFCKDLSVVMYRKFRNVPIFEDFSPICPYFLGFRVGKCDMQWIDKAKKTKLMSCRPKHIVYLMSNDLFHISLSRSRHRWNRRGTAVKHCRTEWSHNSGCFVLGPHERPGFFALIQPSAWRYVCSIHSFWWNEKSSNFLTLQSSEYSISRLGCETGARWKTCNFVYKIRFHSLLHCRIMSHYTYKLNYNLDVYFYSQFKSLKYDDLLDSLHSHQVFFRLVLWLCNIRDCFYASACPSMHLSMYPRSC